MSRILSREEAAGLVERLRRQHRVVVFTNGVFDVLHPGHVRYLAEARRQGDVLIAGVNADASVRRLKGPGRPVNPEAERAEVLAALAAVDAVVVFDEDTPLEIITALQPDVLVKGADWAHDAIVGRDVVGEGARRPRGPCDRCRKPLHLGHPRPGAVRADGNQGTAPRGRMKTILTPGARCGGRQRMQCLRMSTTTTSLTLQSLCSARSPERTCPVRTHG
ncbi:MAG: adenylyltransferase/cytidyltransferase family protein [Vicinamibacterales bacterium]